MVVKQADLGLHPGLLSHLCLLVSSSVYLQVLVAHHLRFPGEVGSRLEPSLLWWLYPMPQVPPLDLLHGGLGCLPTWTSGPQHHLHMSLGVLGP